MSDREADWISCQLGAREHYAVPRALHRAGRLAHFITDAWRPASILTRLPLPTAKRLGERFHPDLATAPMTAFTAGLLRFEFAHRLRKTPSWERIVARDKWFARRAASWLERHGMAGGRVFFSYSYTAGEIFDLAKKNGGKTILGQIDAGPRAEQIIAAEHQRQPQFQSDWKPAPASYWDNWQRECSLADRIIVNSKWSSDCLREAGIAPEKMEIIPLSYETPEPRHANRRDYPNAFSKTRPLSVLFLGSVTLGKGVARLIEAARMLEDEPVQFLMIGATDIRNLSSLIPGNVEWKGPLPRSEVAACYDAADIFVFPTLSDGFGLTQLESQARGLPVIASQHCGQVVQDGVNGFVLPEVSGPAIATTIHACLENPSILARLSRQSALPVSSGLGPVADRLIRLPGEGFAA